jgi:hypothetical protein
VIHIDQLMQFLCKYKSFMLYLPDLCYTYNNHYHPKHQELDPLIRSVSRVTTALASVSSVFKFFSFLVVCSGVISRGFGFVAFFASVKTSCLVFTHNNVNKKTVSTAFVCS